MKYEDFEKCPVFVEIADPDVLADNKFTDLLSYAGMDAEKFKNGAVCAVGTKEGGYEYFDSFASSNKAIEANAGTVSLRKVDGYLYFLTDEYTVFFNDAEGYVRREEPTESAVFAVYYGSRLETLNLSKHYDPVVKKETFTDETLKKVLEKYGY